MKARALIVGVLLLTLCMGSCSPMMGIVEIQTLRPSDDSISFYNKNVAIIGNLYYADPQQGPAGGFLFDSTMISEVTLGLKETLEQSPVFENYTLPIYYSYVSDSSFVGRKIPPNEIDSLAREIEADYIINVDYIIFNAIGESEFADATSRYISDYSALIRTYEASTGRKFLDVNLKNSKPEFLTFNDEYGYPAVVSKDDAKRFFANCVGTEYALRLVPYWENVSRAYYTGPDKNDRYLERASQYVNAGKWDRAIELWESALESPNKTVVAMAAYNLALGSEMMGDFDLALDWLDYSQKQEAGINTSSYKEVIAKRISERKQLDKYMQ